MLSTMEERHRRLLEAEESTLAPPEHRKHTDIAAEEGRRGSPRVPARKSALLPGARPCRGSGPPPGPPPGCPGAAPLPLLTFLGGDHEPPGMIRNTWPLGAAGAQEIRALELEKNRGSRLENKHRFRAWGCPLWGCLPCFLGPPGARFLPVAGTPCPGVTGGSLERELEGRAREGDGKETQQLDGKAPGRAANQPLCFPPPGRHVALHSLVWVCS